MEANNRLLPLWFTRIETGQLRLPRFQRYEAWGAKEVRDLLQAMFRSLPAGALLVLAVGDTEKFVSRAMQGTPAPTENVNEHLLDGQQPLTALWKSLQDLYDDHTYFVRWEIDEETEHRVPNVIGQARWTKNGVRYPLWVDSPAELYARGLIPLKLLRPTATGQDINQWCLAATETDYQKGMTLAQDVNELRQRVATYNIPFLALPVTTPKDVALDVFIKLNTSAVKLTTFDIVVAQVEEATGESLHDIIQKIRATAPGVDRYIEPEDLLLSVAALREDRSPSQASYQKLDFSLLANQWKAIADGIAFMISILEEEHIFDDARLPTVAVLPVLAALHGDMPVSGDAKGNARTLVRAYLWRAFFTDRYTNAAATAALRDFRGLRSTIKDGTDRSTIEIFSPVEFSLPTADELVRTRWPKSKDILARGILAASLRAGAFDLADGVPVSASHIKLREYHHLFPDFLLTQDGRMDESESFRALNCALITWNTNRAISAKEPIKYLRERSERGALGEDSVRTRLRSHLIPYKALNVGGYAAISDPSEREAKVREDFQSFLAKRAASMLPVIYALCEGHEDASSLFSDV
ncbi:GmrSD restriction endonuclease domain-containing protein [Bradyrhizobium pachyrhizi]|uniref:GmrSD restriction endonuclease domain-containing protein n=1 Tax=Bradyrhizobium pachyrhizi TaxID=280333 RepID=UPI0007048F25|nr:DUF262 domain-containing protein [Bradyrhizobium pachyrhizi]